ncbi:hypothetical protein AB4Y64_15765 [Lysobacter sp. TAF61]|uniref:hypothetical protein n=1 Tax=Lysobacter sp. TAF61 TaxID=3233072 RepID=UPI003F9C229B
MNVMTLISALAMVAATHSIATRVVYAQPVEDGAAQTTSSSLPIHDLPGVRVVATLEPEPEPETAAASDETLASADEPRVFDLPTVYVYADHVYADHAQDKPYRTVRSRTALGVPGARTRRGVSPQRTLAGEPVALRASNDRGDRWQAIACVARMRLSRVWPVSRCDIAENARAMARVGSMLATLSAPVRRR